MDGRVCGVFIGLLLVAGCAEVRPQPEPPARGHLRLSPAADGSSGRPQGLEQVALLPPPDAVPDGERYSVAVNDVPVRELLFALARDAAINIDISANITGHVTLNALDQTLPQLLARVARQVPIRYRFINGTVSISADEPYLHTYDVGYVNLTRDVDSTVNVATRVATTGGRLDTQSPGAARGAGGNNASSTRLVARSYNRFWETLRANILALLGEVAVDGEKSDRVIINAEAGMVSVRATERQHALLAEFIERVLRNARRQVLIEATIVEVLLNDQFQAGVDWSLLRQDGASGFNAEQNFLGQITDGVIDSSIGSFSLAYLDPDVGSKAVTAGLRLLREFGDARVLSSPRLMVLNNQTAILKVVEELVYFTLEVTDKDGTNSQQGRTLVESQIRSVPVGLVMAVTPQISSDHEVTLTVRPTISQKIDEAIDPATQLVAEFAGGTALDVRNTVPIIRVRELESVLKLADGHVGVLGGLMQDEVRQGNRELPALARIPLLGRLFFQTRETASRRTELVIFLRPVVVRDPSINTDLHAYKAFLPGTGAVHARPRGVRPRP